MNKSTCVLVHLDKPRTTFLIDLGAQSEKLFNFQKLVGLH
jgi:hypothetical protein